MERLEHIHCRRTLRVLTDASLYCGRYTDLWYVVWSLQQPVLMSNIDVLFACAEITRFDHGYRFLQCLRGHDGPTRENHDTAVATFAQHHPPNYPSYHRKAQPARREVFFRQRGPVYARHGFGSSIDAQGRHGNQLDVRRLRHSMIPSTVRYWAFTPPQFWAPGASLHPRLETSSHPERHSTL